MDLAFPATESDLQLEGMFHVHSGQCTGELLGLGRPQPHGLIVEVLFKLEFPHLTGMARERAADNNLATMCASMREYKEC